MSGSAIILRSTFLLAFISCGCDGKFNSKASTEGCRESECDTNAFEDEHSRTSSPRKLYYAARESKHLVLTPYVQEKRTSEGVSAAKVHPPLLGNIQTYSGFFEVDNATQSFLYFMCFPNMKPFTMHRRDIPVIVFLQGGEGTSVMHSAFRVNGPIRLEMNGSLTYNKYSWAERAHLVYIESPPGAGYSYTKQRVFSKTHEEVATHLYSALKQFITLFRLHANPLYITSTGYGGKYVTSLGTMILHRMNDFKMNFTGVMIGSGFIDPPNQMRYGALLYQLGFIDANGLSKFGGISRNITKLLKEGRTDEASTLYTEWHGNQWNDSIGYITGLRNMNNYLKPNSVPLNDAQILETFFNEPSVMTSLHSNVPYILHNNMSKAALKPVEFESEIENLSLLLNNTRVLLYHGQLAIDQAYVFTLNYLKTVRWTGKKRFEENRRKPWTIGDRVIGYYKVAERLSMVLLRNAGNEIALDQPRATQIMIDRYVHKQPLNKR